ncbi:AAA family ATPase [Rhodovibrio salinarum]|uniref:CobQ/CobB/MinD/ParA nucleotide binding domain-containing protein n=1 Tax=Rhodovibrio salinarum TaxID=1087 RepID=A0A934UZD9_9PROT|nr:AAA family ATPase [Rhodovibrio salinarum]MBK1696628.1 hypothetical protein [Rhodovibrio salinarum]
MAIVLIGGEKGGAGNTTIAVHLAANRARAGRDVMLVDADRQGSASNWVALRDETDAPRIECVSLQGKGMVTQVRELAKRHDEIIIDTGGQDSVELRGAMTTAHRMIIPVQASLFDTWTIDSMAKLVEEASGFNPELYAYACINRASTNPRVREADEARELIGDYDNLGFLTTILCDRIAYRRAVRTGHSVEENSDDPQAAAEISHLASEIYRSMSSPPHHPARPNKPKKEPNPPDQSAPPIIPT